MTHNQPDIADTVAYAIEFICVAVILIALIFIHN